MKGRIKEAAGALTDNDKLREEGRKDQAIGHVKETIEKVADEVEKAVEKIVNKVKKPSPE